MTPQEKAALQANAAIGAPVGAQGSTPSGAPDFASALQKKYKVTPLTKQTPAAQTGGFDIGALLGGAGNAITGAATGMAGAVVQGASDVLGNIGNAAQAFNPMSTEDVGQRAQRLGQVAQNAVTPALNTITGLAGNIAGGVQKGYQGIMSGDITQGTGQMIGGLGQIAGAGQDFLGAANPLQGVLSQIPKALGTPATFADAYSRMGEATGKQFASSAVKTAQSVPNVIGGIGDIAQGDNRGVDKLLRQGLFQGVSGAANMVYSPLAGIMATQPGGTTEALSRVMQGFEQTRDAAYRSAGIDPQSLEAQNFNAGIQALLDIAPVAGYAGKLAKAGKLGKTAQNAFQSGAAFSGQAASTINNTVKGVGDALKNAVKRTGNFALDTSSNAVWSTPAEVMKKVTQYGDDIAPYIGKADDLGEIIFPKLQTSLDDVFQRVSGAGKEYDAVRKATETVALRADDITSALSKSGVTLKNGKLAPIGDDILNTRLTDADLQYLNTKLLPSIPVGKNMTAAQVLNARQKLDDFIYARGIPEATDAVKSAAKQMRDALNTRARTSIPVLQKVDDAFAPQKRFLEQVKRDLMTRDKLTGQFELKRNIQPETLQNLLRPQNKKALKTLEEAMPGITKDLDMLNTVKQIEKAQNISTGASLKRLSSAVAGNTVGGPIGGLAAYLLTDPVRAAQIFAKLGSKSGVTGKVKGGVQGAGEAVKGSKEVIKTAAARAVKNKKKLADYGLSALTANPGQQ